MPALSAATTAEGNGLFSTTRASAHQVPAIQAFPALPEANMINLIEELSNLG
jgi:hypothetical protein